MTVIIKDAIIINHLLKMIHLHLDRMNKCDLYFFIKKLAFIKESYAKINNLTD